MKELVSIITPSYNSERFISETILSVLSQSYAEWELIIVDDCSTDSSLDIAYSFADTDDRIKIFRQAENSGPAAARNEAIKLARGRFVAFLDSDDIWHPEKLEKQLKFMLENGYAFTFTEYDKISENGTPYQSVSVPDRVSYRSLLKVNVIGCLTVMYDSELIGKVFMPTSSRREDYATWLGILKDVGYAYGVREALAYYRVYDGQGSANKLDMARECWKLYREVERLSLIKSAYFFSHYAIYGVLRHKMPSIAKKLGF